MKLSELLTKARRFVDGVCALQDVTKLTDAINGWATRREEVVRGGFLRLLKDLGYEHASMLRWLNDQAIESDYLPPKWHARVDELEQQLAAEREAHEETKQRFDLLAHDWNPIAVWAEIHAAKSDRSVAQRAFDRIGELQRGLSAERESHEETKQRWATVSDEWNGAAEECIELRKQLSAARADLESLTRWNLQSEKPCPVDPDIDVSLLTARYGICLDKVSTMIATDSWRFTPESLAAWKAREGERDV